MEQYKRKHYFFTASFGLVVFFVVSGFVSPILFADEKKPKHQKQKTVAKKDALNSLQKKIVKKEPGKVLSEDRNLASIPKVEKKSKKRKKFFPSFLKKQYGDYFWQPNVYAVPKKGKNKSEGKVLGQFDRFSIIDTRGMPSGSFPIIWSKKHSKYGVYTGKIIILSEQGGVKDFLKQKGHRFSNLSGSFIVDIDNLDDAFSLVQNIEDQFPKTLVDIDINMH